MATRKRRTVAKKAAVKKTSNSKVAEVSTASARKASGDSLRGQSAMEQSRPADRIVPPVGTLAGPEKFGPGKPVAPSPGIKNNPGYPGDPNYNKPQPGRNTGMPDRTKASKQPGDADAPSGLLGLLSIDAPVKQPSAITNPSLYGVSNKDRAARLSDLMNAQADAQNQQLKSKGNAVYMGPKQVKIRNTGPGRLDENGQSTTTEQAGSQVYSKDQLMGWLADDAKVAQIKAAMEKAGLAVQTYDDIAKLWASVLDTAANAYSVNGQQVTPWAVLQLRGKHTVNGRMPDKTTTQTTFDQMDPLTARKMFEDTAQQALGRAPTKAEVDDFIAKAQTIAHSNPTVTRTVSQMNFDGTVKDQQSSTTGGVGAQGYQQAALDQAKQSEDYAAFQAAGTYFPQLFEALKSPV